MFTNLIHQSLEGQRLSSSPPRTDWESVPSRLQQLDTPATEHVSYLPKPFYLPEKAVRDELTCHQLGSSLLTI